MTAEITQQTVEVIASGEPKAQITQQVIEVLAETLQPATENQQTQIFIMT